MKRRGRLLATIAGLSLATLGGSFFAVYVANNRAQQRQLDTALVHEAAEEAREAAQAGGEKLMISARPGPQANDTGPLTKYAAIYEPDGSLVAVTPTFHAGPPAFASLTVRGTPFDFWYEQQHLRGIVVPIPAAPHTSLLLAAPRTDLDGDEAFLARAMSVVLGFAFAWVLLIASWVVRRFTRGHEAIARVARSVTSGNLSARVSWPEEDEEVGQLASDVNHMIAQLGTLMVSHRLFIANAAHELRSPLTALYGELSHALRRSRDADAYRAAISEALDSTKRLMTLAEDLLALARLSASSDESSEPVELSDAILRAASSVAQSALARAIELDIKPFAGTLPGRPKDLERLFRNLLENAVLYSPPGGTVSVRCESGRNFVVRVHNQGELPAERDRLFEPFNRGPYSQANDQPGTGLGLPMARQVAWAHGGNVDWVDEEPGIVTIQVTLPRTPQPSSARPLTAPEEP